MNVLRSVRRKMVLQAWLELGCWELATQVRCLLLEIWIIRKVNSKRFLCSIKGILVFFVYASWGIYQIRPVHDARFIIVEIKVCCVGITVYLPDPWRGRWWIQRWLTPKTLDRRPCTGRSQEAVVIFLFGLEALLTRVSRVLSYAASSSPNYRLLLVITVIKHSFYWLPQ